MASKVVYLVPKLLPGMREKFVTDETLDELLADGWEITSTVKDHHTSAGSTEVKCVMMILKQASDNRGVAVIDRSDEEETRSIASRGMSRELALGMEAIGKEISRALARSNEPSHLGSPTQNNIPGLSIVSSTHVAQAFDAGLLAGHAGQTMDDNPFPRGSTPYVQWARGFAHSKTTSKGPEVVSEREKSEAFILGCRVAEELQDFEDVEVPCPYQRGSVLQEKWLEGFRSKGGRVE